MLKWVLRYLLEKGRSHGVKMSVFRPTVKTICTVWVSISWDTRLPGVQLCIVICGFASSLTALFAVRKKKKKSILLKFLKQIQKKIRNVSRTMVFLSRPELSGQNNSPSLKYSRIYKRFNIVKHHLSFEDPDSCWVKRAFRCLLFNNCRDGIF